ncbi:hypothetical protein Ais01nite_65120 [Asanoa ishikariensis]|uniref:CARDB protein n=2 Tax=Asanoa ishikariensis TaxID=137265 RepID=A0A1H3NP56_9ACTN|nr:hypothetical protein Ais01nite_65120 [Asanoa ishikariensis]SDY90578.1 CARDB protein [Asanoa ishikariensis]
MSEFDDLINDALGDFRAAEADNPSLTPGAAAARATIKHRRTVRLATLSVLGALVIAVPIAAFAADPHGNNPPPAPADSLTPGPVESPTPTATPTPSRPSSPVTPDGVITLKQLGSTAVDIPAFSNELCPATHVRLATANPHSQGKAWIAKVVHTNLDDDPGRETAALLLCQIGEVPTSQVVAFDRDAAGKIRPIGQVVGEGYKLNIRDIRVRAQGGITADVSDMIACCDTPVSREQHQQRAYRWNGTKFTQLGGPTVFGDPDSVTDLKVSVSDVTLGPATDGKRSGTMTVTVKNNGPNSSGRFQVGFGDCTFKCAGQIPFWAWGSYGTYQAPLAPGQSAKKTIKVSFDANTTGGEVGAWLVVIGVDNNKSISDLDPGNDTTRFRIRLG